MKIIKGFPVLFSSIVLSVLLFSVAASAIHVEESVFTDVDSGDTSYEAIKYLKDKGVIVGYTDGSYKPDATINRAEFLKIVMEGYGYAVEGYSDCFLDVTDQWFAPYVCKAENLGIVSGYGDGYYKPDRDINFAEASKIVAEAFRLVADSSDDETWYQQFVISLELMSAIPTSVDSFAKNITRGEMAEMVWRIKAEKTTEASSTYAIIKDGEEVPTSESGDVTSITLIDKGDGNVKWSTDGYSESGFKLVWSKTSGPTYPTRSTDKYKYHSDPSTYLSSITAFDGDGTYHVRVCEYLGGACGVYSNEIEVEMGADTVKDETEDDVVESTGVTSITLINDFNGEVSWIVNGVSSQGYKVVWSKTPEPTYPNRATDEYYYYSDLLITSTDLEAFDGDGTYYVRVCEYLGGACGVYSNEVEVELADSIADTVISLTLSDNGDGTVGWVVDGTSDSGYKVVWSTRTDDQYLYYSSSAAVASSVLDAFDGAGTYYVRVCEYLGGACGVYSNEIEMEL